MSRIGVKPIPILDGVKIDVKDRVVSVEGPVGKLTWEHPENVSVVVKDVEEFGNKPGVAVSRQDDERASRANHGLTRALIANMITGAKTGYQKKMEIVGVGYLAQLAGKTLKLRVGYKNEIVKTIPDDLKVTVSTPTEILIFGADKQRVGQFAAELRAAKKPEPYKGKGIRYSGEFIKLKPGKAAKK